MKQTEDRERAGRRRSAPGLSHHRPRARHLIFSMEDPEATVAAASPPGTPERVKRYYSTAAHRDHLDLWRAAREGDLERCRFLVEVKGHDVNAVNHVNAVPLYYAALCGHLEVIDFLLSAGARADAGTFVGERVFYAALSDKLRKYLRSVNLNAAYRDPYLEALRGLYENRHRPDFFPDLVFSYYNNQEGEDDDDAGGVAGDEGEDAAAAIRQRRRRTTACHRAVLRARSAYLDKALRTRWAGKRSIRLQHSQEAFECLLAWLYTGKLELPAHLLRDAVKLCNALQLRSLKQALRRKVLLRDGEEESDNQQQGQQQQQHQRRMITIEPDRDEVAASFQALAQEVLAAVADDADLLVTTEDGEIFALHRVILAARSEYFRCMFQSGFQEGVSSSSSAAAGQAYGDDADPDAAGTTGLPSIQLSVSSAAFRLVVEHLYGDDVPALAPQHCDDDGDEELKEEPTPARQEGGSGGVEIALIVEVLDAATRFLLPGLRNLCCTALIARSDEIDVFSLHELATLYELPRLEHHVSHLLARDLAEVIGRPEFTELLNESAASIQAREAADSIPFLDDVRYHVMRLHRFEEEALEEKFGLIDELLARLNLGMGRED